MDQDVIYIDDDERNAVYHQLQEELYNEGGYLVIDARKLLVQPFAWEELKRALRANHASPHSLDIDGNDYWVWQAIDAVDPAIVACEYNPILGDTPLKR